MHISLWKWDLDAGFGKSIVYAGVQFVHEPAAIMGPFGPAQQLEFQGRVAECSKTDAGLRILGCQRIGSYLSDQNGFNLFYVRTIGHTDFDAYSKHGLGRTLIDDLGVGDDRVRDGYHDIVTGLDARTAQADLHHLTTFVVVEDNVVPRPEWSIQEDRHAAEKVG